MPKLILITGGSSSGKTTVAKNVKEALGENAILISQDMFYKPQNKSGDNYDTPSAFDWETQHKVIKSLKEGKRIKGPIYSFHKNDRTGWEMLEPAKIIIFEGLFSFWDDEICKEADLQIFVDTPSDTRLSRRLVRDIKHRGREPLGVIEVWLKNVAPAYNRYIKPMKRRADLILPWEKVGNKGLSTLIVALHDMVSNE